MKLPDKLAPFLELLHIYRETGAENSESIPSFKIKFRMTDYTEKEVDVDKKVFKNIKKGDSGVLTYQGSRYLGFIKD